MRNYTLDELRETFSALDAHERGDYAALRRADPLVDQLQAVRDPSVLAVVDGGTVVVQRERAASPGVRGYPILSAGLDRAQAIPLRYDLVGLAGVDRVLSNNGRRVLPETSHGYSVDELRAEERARLGISRKEQAILDAEHAHGLAVVEYGGQPTPVVVFHCAEWTEPDGVLACPVPPYWTGRRIARLVTLASCACYWCNRREERSLDDYLLVDTGFLRVFPTCPECRAGFDRDTGHRGLDWLTRSDDWDASVGYPSDEWR
ncbi:hypothetical protein F8M49_15645 [Rhodococcus zopfii]|uniref:Uncharacterized protein n=1 Tax=Rhodococcus zopfii TaxID=43772 RepID=A0ABU3WQW9_9NOCA|nr:hypothetical protein [Rhodococcus zopfii]